LSDTRLVAVGKITAPDAKPGWSSRAAGTDTVLCLSGDWSAREVRGDKRDPLTILDRTGLKTLHFDATRLQSWDTSLLVFLSDMRRHARARGVELDAAGLPEPARRLLGLLSSEVFEPPPPAPHAGLVAGAGKAVIDGWMACIAMTGLVGETLLRSGAALAGRARMRRQDLFTCMRDAGFAALPIVAIVNLLVGGILAFVGAVQLKRFGAEIYVANLVGIGMAREMAALMTAIVMAGRTGGAIAAEIASMQGAEEIDALRAIGIPIQDYLILPRILALTAMMPMLYLYGCAIGIFGGFAVAIATLHVTPASFNAQLLQSLTGSQIVFGLVKSLCFGVLVAIVGCRIGLEAGRSASDVGHAATSAVVTGIVGVIALDAIFAVCANGIGV
jgi:phospholipid/cholesterol/gamma-HCH transport system permease protein